MRTMRKRTFNKRFEAIAFLMLLFAIMCILVLGMWRRASLSSAQAPELHCAASNGDTDKVREMIATGADLNGLGAVYGRGDRSTALCVAAREGNGEIVRLLVEGGADVNRGSPLTYAIQGDNHDIAVQLIAQGADPSRKTYDGLSPIQCALQAGDLKMVTLLSTNGVRISEEPGATDWAALGGSVEVLEYVLSQGGTLEVDGDGSTALHTAAAWGHVKMVKFLCDRGMNVNVQDIDGRTPLHLACATNNIAVVRILLENGANTHVKDDSGATPADIATEEGYRSILEELK